MTSDGWAGAFVGLLGLGVSGLLMIALTVSDFWSRPLWRTVSGVLFLVSIIGAGGVVLVMSGVFPSAQADHMATNSRINAPGNMGIITQDQTGSNKVGN